MFVLLVMPEPELSFQALQAGTGAGVPSAPSAKSSLVLQGKTLSCRLGDPPGAAFSEPSPWKHGKEGKSVRGTWCFWLLPSPESCCRDGQEGARLSVLPTALRTLSVECWSCWKLCGESPWLLTEQCIYIPHPMPFQRCLHIHSIRRESGCHSSKKLISEEPNELELSSHPATHPTHVQDGKQLQHMLP